jgi:hypothetical protein
MPNAKHDGVMRGWVVIVVGIIAGCGTDQTGLPQPIPVPDAALVRAQGVPEGTTGQSLVVGLPGVVEGAGRISVETEAGLFESEATGAGSFNLLITARAGEAVALRFKTSDPVSIRIEALPAVIPPAAVPRPLDGPPPPQGPVVPPQMVAVWGIASANSRIIGVNIDTGDVATTTADDSRGSEGEFVLVIVGASGHRLRIYEDRPVLLDSWDLVLP